MAEEGQKERETGRIYCKKFSMKAQDWEQDLAELLGLTEVNVLFVSIKYIVRKMVVM